VGATALLARLDLGQRPSAPKPAVQPTTAAVTPPTAVWPSARRRERAAHRNRRR
jgi:hypothetical protein